MIGIICALQEEIDGIICMLSDRMEQVIFNQVFVIGVFQKKSVVCCCSGAGKVNSAMCAAIMINTYTKIECLINLGVSGAICPEIKQGNIIIASKLLFHDCFGVFMKPKSDLADSIYFNSDVESVKKMEKALCYLKQTYYIGLVITGDQFICTRKKAMELYNLYSALSCDMESTAIAQVCSALNRKFLSVKLVSDYSNNSACIDFKSFLRNATNVCSQVITEFLREE